MQVSNVPRGSRESVVHIPTFSSFTDRVVAKEHFKTYISLFSIGLKIVSKCTLTYPLGLVCKRRLIRDNMDES